jgi:Fe2+ or Zn2+ uptake regulation protein
MQMLNHFLDDLSASGHSRSAGRIAVFEYLLSQGAVSPRKLTEDLVGQLDRASLYRTLALFRELGIIDELGFGSHRTLELSDRYAPHHHHLRCRICGKVSNVDDSALEKTLKVLAKNNNFVLENHVLELIGKCESCPRTREVI